MADAYCTYDDCGYPCPDQAYLCERHTGELREELERVEKIADEFDDVLARQTNVRGLDRGAGASVTPLPYDDRATESRMVLTATITAWARGVAEERGLDLPAPPAAPDGPGCAGGTYCTHGSCRAIRRADEPSAETLAAQMLLENLQWLRFQRYAHEAADELISAIRSSTFIVDLRAPKLYLGRCGAAAGDNAACPCDCHVGGLDAPCSIHGGCGLDFHVAATGPRCNRDLYARPDRATITCPGCGTRYDVAERKAHAINVAKKHEASARQISELCRHMLGEDVSTAMIRGYAKRGRIKAVNTTTDDRGREVPTYVVDDVINVVRLIRRSPELRREARKAALEELASDATNRELTSVG